MTDSLDSLADGATLDLGSDLAEAVDEIIDLKSLTSMLNPYTYDISVAYDLDGKYNEYEVTPSLGIEKPGTTLWVLMTSGFFHRIKIEANADRQYYHIRLAEATMVYQGQLA